METFAVVLALLPLPVLVWAIAFAWRTRPLRPQSAAAEIPDALPSAPPTRVGPLGAALLVNRTRRALGAAVVDLVGSGRVAVDADAGPTAYRLTLVDPLVRYRDLEREAVQEALFGRDAKAGATFDVDRRDREKNQRMRQAAVTARRYLVNGGFLRGERTRQALHAANWVMVTVGFVELLVDARLVVVIAGQAVAIFVARRASGWLRTPPGESTAREVVAFEAALRSDPQLARRYPGWAHLFDDRTPRPLTSTPAVIAGDGVTGDEHRGLGEEWASDIGWHFDGGGGDTGGSDSGSSDGGGDGGGGGGD
ncbi:hypothetical protein ACFXQA_08905 [Microbacterium sp. P07]|uniref:hypothetical protein n=1 Tax=Microbacterium sp. P07 TaxID=3366952 RepID=UPI003745CD74